MISYANILPAFSLSQLQFFLRLYATFSLVTLLRYPPISDHIFTYIHCQSFNSFQDNRFLKVFNIHVQYCLYLTYMYTYFLCCPFSSYVIFQNLKKSIRPKMTSLRVPPMQFCQNTHGIQPASIPVDPTVPTHIKPLDIEVTINNHLN